MGFSPKTAQALAAYYFLEAESEVATAGKPEVVHALCLRDFEKFLSKSGYTLSDLKKEQEKLNKFIDGSQCGDKEFLKKKVEELVANAK